MKQLITYNRAAGYLNMIFDLLNDRYFESALSRPVITIQSTPKAYGHYTTFDAWSIDGEKGVREINIGAGTLSRPIENVVATLLHEMCHYWNDRNGVKDTSRGSMYHNKHFRETAEARDLQVTHHDKYGWAITAPTDALVEFCLEHNLTEIRLNRIEGISVRVTGTGTPSGAGDLVSTGTKTKKPSSSRKYVCPCCGTSVRATKTVNIGCLDCVQVMVLAA